MKKSMKYIEVSAFERCKQKMLKKQLYALNHNDEDLAKDEERNDDGKYVKWASELEQVLDHDVVSNKSENGWNWESELKPNFPRKSILKKVHSDNSIYKKNTDTSDDISWIKLRKLKKRTMSTKTNLKEKLPLEKKLSKTETVEVTQRYPNKKHVIELLKKLNEEKSKAL